MFPSIYPPSTSGFTSLRLIIEQVWRTLGLRDLSLSAKTTFLPIGCKLKSSPGRPLEAGEVRQANKSTKNQKFVRQFRKPAASRIRKIKCLFAPIPLNSRFFRLFEVILASIFFIFSNLFADLTFGPRVLFCAPMMQEDFLCLMARACGTSHETAVARSFHGRQ